MNARRRCPPALLLTLTLAVAAQARPCQAALTEGPRLAAIYDTILQGRFDQAEAALQRACPPAPQGACRALGAVVVWWQILLDPDSHSLDDRLSREAAAAIAANEAWTREEPKRAEAWFYLAGSYAPLVNLRVLRGERLAAARDGKRIKDALEQALALDPALADAHFGIGLYHYYAAVAPAAARMLRWLLLLPGGDRIKGMAEMREARDRGELLRGEANYQLHILDLWYEQKPGEALTLLRTLDAQYGSNPLFLQRIAEVQADYFHDYPASAASWEMLLDRARGGRVVAAGAAEVQAQLGLASALDAMFETDRAIDQLKAIIARKPAAPSDAGARAQLQLGAAYDRLGQRDLALGAYAAAMELASTDDSHQIRERARAGMRTPADGRTGGAYRLSLEAWRAFERGDVARAATTLARTLTLAPGDSMMRYRYARVLAARGDHGLARAQLEQVLAARPVAPPIVLAAAYVDCAQLLEQAGDRTRATAMYRVALQVEGGDPRVRDRAARALKRLDAPDSARATFFDKFRTLCLTAESSRH